MFTTTLRTLPAVLPILLLVACAGCQEKGTPWQEVVPGLSYVDSTLGQGDLVEPGDFVVAHYTGWVYDLDKQAREGSPFDSSVERGEPIGFPIGRGMVIPGWEKGVAGMHVGGKRTLLISPDLAYGADGRPPVIPPSATLIFDVEVVDLPQVAVEVLTEGTGVEAELGDQLSVHYTGWVWEQGAKGEKFDSSHDRGRPYEFALGRGMVIPGWDMALLGMKQGTTARLIIPPVMAYGSRGAGSIPPDATLCFEIELVQVGGE
jgi:peptidylprolyl isomerase